jgi:hypothetical protein
MLIGRGLAIAILGASAALSAAWAQTPKTLTARELFYAPVSQEAPAKSNPPRPAKKATAAKPPSSEAKPPSSTAQAASNSNKAVVKAPNTAGAPAQSGDLPLVQASYGGKRPLGLRYGFLRKGAGDEYEEVNADSVFHAGDRIRFSVQTNDTAYLYIVMRGSSGTWKVLFPTNEVGGGSNLVEGGHSYVFPPPPGRFAFDEQKGEEKLCLVVTRRPEESLEQLIYALSSGAGVSQPASEKASKPMLLAQSRPIDDGLVNRLHNQVYARDLVFEKVDESTPGDKKEKAAYVVNSNPAPDARLVVDLILKHE